MASITSLSNSSYNTSSIYGNRNVLSGLASGMDTESMIENAVSGIKLKIQNLAKRRTKIEWQQEAYRSIIDKAVNFNTKYTSYSSKTNLLSQSFFNNAVNTTTNGTYKDKISASGRTSSDIKINSVKQMATAAAYTVSGMGGAAGQTISGITGDDFNIAGTTDVSTLSGSLTFQYGGTNGTTFDISFKELEDLREVEVYNANGTVKKNATNAEKLAQAINNKLGEISYTYTKNGYQESSNAGKAIVAKASADGTITFTDGLNNGNKINITSASGKIKNVFGIGNNEETTSLAMGNRSLTTAQATSTYLTGKSLGVTFNGTTKNLDMSKVIQNAGFSSADDDKTKNVKFRIALQNEVDSAFGAGKIQVSQGGSGPLSLTPLGKGDTMSVGGSAVEALGFENGDSNFLNTSKKLSDLLGSQADSIFTRANRLQGAGGATMKTSANGDTYYVDKAGNRVDKTGYRVDNNDNPLYDFEVNGAHISVSEDTTLESLMNSINSNADAGVKVSYSKLTNEFKFTATETGANGKIEFGKLGSALFGDTASAANPTDYGKTKLSDILGDNYDYGSQYANFSMNINGEDFTVHADKDSTVQDIVDQFNDMLDAVGGVDEKYAGVKASFDSATNSLVFTDKDGNAVESSAANAISQSLTNTLKAATPAGSYTHGQDAILDVTINGTRFDSLTRSSNSFDLDGLTVNVKGTFDAVGKDGEDYEPISFTTATDTDKIVDAIRDFVNDYNEMITEIKGAYTTTPATQTDGSRYEPLTAEEEDGMTESEIKAYEEKAKQGILFSDSTLSSMYSRLLNAITPGGSDGQTLREIGIGTSYSSGLTTISLDEDKLRAALESDPDKVKNAFTKTKEGGSASDGLVKTMQNTLNTYVKTTGEPKGVLITRAGSIKSPTSINSNSLQSQINNIDNQIERWQTKMSNQIDRYTTQFSRLEQLIAEMNSQASAFAGLMGGDSGY